MQKPNTNFPGVYFRDILHGIYPNPNKLTHLNQRFLSVPKQVCTVTRTHIFYLILYVGILRMYMIVNIFLVDFSITVSIKFLETLLDIRSDQKQQKKIIIKQRHQKQTVSVLYIISHSFQIMFLSENSVMSANTFTRICIKD